MHVFPCLFPKDLCRSQYDERTRDAHALVLLELKILRTYTRLFCLEEFIHTQIVSNNHDEDLLFRLVYTEICLHKVISKLTAFFNWHMRQRKQKHHVRQEDKTWFMTMFLKGGYVPPETRSYAQGHS